MKKIVIISIIAIIGWGVILYCGIKRSKTDLPPFATSLSVRDSADISDKFYEQTEYFRLYYPLNREVDSVYYENHPGTDDRYQLDCFYPFMCAYNSENASSINSPWPTRDMITVETEGIYYSNDSLLCVAIVSIRAGYRLENGVSFGPAGRYKYSGMALLGCRAVKEERFKIFPYTFYNTLSMDSREEVVGYVLNGYKHISNNQFFYTKDLGEEGFFETSPPFQKRSDGHYVMEYYKETPYHESKPYIFFCNYPDSIKKRYQKNTVQ